MIGQFLDTVTVQVIKSDYNGPSKSNCWKLFLATLKLWLYVSYQFPGRLLSVSAEISSPSTLSFATSET